MSPESIQHLKDGWLIALQFFGVASLAGCLAFLAAYYAFPPNLTVEEVKDKGKFNFESRLIVRNIGKMPAYHIVADVQNMNLRMGGFNINNANMKSCGIHTTQLASSEKMELPVCPHIGLPVSANLDSCDYTLTLNYELRLPFFKNCRSKSWRIELRNAQQEFAWQIALL
jgi:hypothetical protein